MAPSYLLTSVLLWIHRVTYLLTHTLTWDQVVPEPASFVATLTKRAYDSTVKVPPWQCPRSAPVPRPPGQRAADFAAVDHPGTARCSSPRSSASSSRARAARCPRPSADSPVASEYVVLIDLGWFYRQHHRHVGRLNVSPVLSPVIHHNGTA